MKNRKSGWYWLTAVAEVSLHNQSHWWVIPASLLLFGAVTAVQLAPYQAVNGKIGDGSLILFGNANLRFYIINPIYLFIASNIGGHERIDDLLLHRLGSRVRLWLGKGAVFVGLTVAYLALVILFTEAAFLPFISHSEPGWSEKLLAYYGEASFAGNLSQNQVWGSTVWFVFLSWLSLGGTAFVIAQTTRRAGFGFVAAIGLNLSGFLFEMLNPASINLSFLDIRRPMLFLWFDTPQITFGAATAYWFIWFLVLGAVSFWIIERAGGRILVQLRAWMRGAWFIIHLSLGRSWLIVGLFALISAWVDRQLLHEIEAVGLVGARLAPVVGLSGPSLEAPLFSLIFLRWLLLFLLYLFILGETAVAVLWQQHVILLPRLGSRGWWWLSNGTAVAGLAFLYLWIVVGSSWLINRPEIKVDGLLFYSQIIALYWLTFTFLGCAQLLLLLFTQSRSQTLFTMVLFVLVSWLVGTKLPQILPWLPVAQTAILAQLLQHDFVQMVGPLLMSGVYLLLSISLGLFVIQRYEFAGFLKHH